MKHKLLNKLLTLTLLIMGGAILSPAWGDEESVIFSEQGYTNQQTITSYTGTNFSLAFNKGTNNSNAPKYYSSGTAIRAYGGNTMKVSSEKTITKIVITFGSSDGSNAITTDVGEYSNGTWTGSDNEVTFTIGGTSGNRRLSSVTVTYTEGGGSTPSISADPASISGFTYVEGNGPSAAQTVSVSGSDLTENISLSLGDNSNYEMCLTENGTYTNSLMLTPTTGTVSETDIYVRLKSGLAKAASYAGTITLTSTGATNETVSLSGSVTGQTYSISVDDNITGGTIEADLTSAAEGATVTLTAHPDDAYTFGSWSVYKTGDQSTTVTVSSNQFTMPDYAVTVTATFNAKPTHTATFSVNGNTTSNTFYEGQAITFPTAVETTPVDGSEFPKVINGQTFQGWYTGEYSNASVAPNYVNTAEAAMGTSDTTYYAVYADYVVAVHDYVTDELTLSKTGVSGSTYTAWSNKSDQSDAKYAGQSAGNNSSIQLRSSNPSGIITTASGGILTNVTINWNNNTIDTRYVSIYGNNTAYTESADLYTPSKRGTYLGEITKGSSTELNVSGSYSYLGILANSPLYINKISITWDKGTPASCSNYTTDNRAAAGIAYANATMDVKLTSGYTGQALTNTNSVSGITYSSSDATVATVNSSTGAITELLKVGSTTITASFAGNATYKPAEVSYTLNVTEKTPAGLAYATDAVEKLTTDAAFTNTLTNGYSLSVSYSSSDEDVAIVDEDGEVTIKGAGSTTITATFAGDEDYEAGSASYTLTVSKATPTLSFASDNAIGREGEAFAGNALTNPADLTVTYSSSDTDVATVNSSTGAVTIVADGTTTITASFAGNDTYTSGSASYTLKVLDTPTISVSDDEVAYGETYEVDDSGITGGDITVTSGNTSIATVDGLEITPVACGSVTITVRTAENDTYKAGEETFTLTVTAPEGKTTAKLSGTQLLFGESFGNNTGSARDWSDSYSVKSGISDVYSGITSYTVSNVKQGKNTTGSTQSGLNQSTSGTDAYIIIGPLNVADYSSLSLTYQWKAGSVGGTYTTALYYKTSSSGDFTSVSGTGNGATSFVERSYSLPAAAQVATLYLKIVWNTSNTQAIIDEVQLKGTAPAITKTLNASGYGTFCSEYPLDFTGYATADYSAWEITNINESEDVYTITFNKLTGTIKGGQGILLKGTANATVTLTSSNSTNVLDNNLLVGTTAPTYVTVGEYYGLSGNNFVRVATSTVPAGKALLPVDEVDGSSPVKAFTFIFEDDADGIRTIENVSIEEAAQIFDLSGRRLNKMQKGINIVNGRKVLK